MGQNYKNPPLVEAVCEFIFTENTEWDQTISGLIYEKIKGEYPKKETRVQADLEIIVGPKKEPEQKIRTNEIIMFKTEDGTKLVQIGPRKIAINFLKPYPSWIVFKKEIGEIYKKMNEIVVVKGLKRIGMRYINRIEIPGEKIELEDYFVFRPFLGKELEKHAIGRFDMTCLLNFPGKKDLCNIILTDFVLGTKGKISFALDIDYFSEGMEQADSATVLEWVDNAHKNVEMIFESCITDKMKGEFQK